MIQYLYTIRTALSDPNFVVGRCTREGKAETSGVSIRDTQFNAIAPSPGDISRGGGISPLFAIVVKVVARDFSGSCPYIAVEVIWKILAGRGECELGPGASSGHTVVIDERSWERFNRTGQLTGRKALTVGEGSIISEISQVN